MVTGREPSEELVEPLSWEIWKIIQERRRARLPARPHPAPGRVARVDRAVESHDVVLTPALAERPVPIGEIDACSDDPLEDFRRSGRFTPYTASST